MKFHCLVFRVLSVLLVSSFVAGPVLAQDEEKKGGRALRLLPVGDAPPFQQVIQGGRRVQVDPPEGSEPPAQVQLTDGKGGEIGNAVRMRLNQVTQVIPVNPGNVPLHETSKDGLEPAAWHTLRFGNANAGLAVLWRDPQKGKWSTARSKLLPDDVTSFPAGRVRIVNVSKYPIGMLFGKERGTLKPGQVLYRPAPSGQTVPLELHLKQGRGWVRVFAQNIKQSARERTNVILYTADGVKPLKPVTAVILSEAARTPTVPR